MPKVEVVELLREVPVPQVEYIEKIVEVPEIRYVEKIIEVPPRAKMDMHFEMMIPQSIV